MFKGVISQLLAVKVPETLFHYTSSAGLMGILASKKIWTTKIHYLNDNSEMRLGIEYIRNEIERQQKGVGKTRTEEELDSMISTLSSINKVNTSLASFTEMGDQLSQWRGYCEIGKGYSLGFDAPKLRKHIHNQTGYNLVPCIYDEKEHERLAKELVDHYPTSEMLETVKDMPLPFFIAFSNAVLFLAPLLKSKSFEEEREWRLITPAMEIGDAKFRNGRHSLIPYWEIDLDIENTIVSITIGPTPEPILSSEAVKGLLYKEFLDKSRLEATVNRINEIDILQSKIPFRDV